MTIRKFFSLSVRGFLATALSVVFAFALSARPVDVHSAKRIAEGFFHARTSQLRAGEDQSIRLEAVSLRTSDKSFTLITTEDPLLRSGAAVAPASFYVFNRGVNGGYAIIAGDDLLTPILGYSLSGQIDLKDAPQYLLGFFEKVNQAIENVLQSGDPIALKEMAPIAAKSVKKDFPTTVEPLLGEIAWDQGFPWNKQCPNVKDQMGVTMKAPVGCVATAMSQIMRYHEWPTQGEGSSSYTDRGSAVTLSADYGKTTYDYSLMPKSQKHGKFTEAEEDEVAKLSSHAGISVEMMYGANGSGAFSFNVGKAFRNHFRYDKNTMILPRDAYSTEDWYGYVFGDLAAGLPVYYAGAGSGGGHAFVFDGYDKDGNVHVNWGWAGMSNGYFNMNLLNPSALGTGGGTGGGFNYYQNCTVNLKPDKTGTSVAPNGKLYYDMFIVNIDETKKQIAINTFRCFPYDLDYNNGEFAIAAEAFDGGEVIVGKNREDIFNATSTQPYVNSSLVETSFSNLKDGYYLIHPVYKVKNKAGEDVWEPILYLPMYKNSSPIRHALIKVSGNGTKWEKVAGVSNMERTSIAFTTRKAAGESFLFKANGIASAKQSGLESVPLLNGEEQQLVLKSDKVNIEGFFNTLTVQNAGISELLLNATSSLTKLDMRNNEISYLNAGHMPEIDSLDLSFNKLSVLTLDGCEKLKYINLSGNPLGPKEIAQIISSLPKRPYNSRGRLVLREISDTPHAQDVWAFAPDVQLATVKNWWVMTYNPADNTYGVYKGVPSGVEEVAEEGTPKLYPSPATDRLYLKGIEEGVAIELYSLSGELLLTQKAIQGTNVVLVSDLPRGQYLLKAGDFKQKVTLQSEK